MSKELVEQLFEDIEKAKIIEVNGDVISSKKYYVFEDESYEDENVMSTYFKADVYDETKYGDGVIEHRFDTYYIEDLEYNKKTKTYDFSTKHDCYSVRIVE